MLYSGGCDLAC